MKNEIVILNYLINDNLYYKCGTIPIKSSFIEKIINKDKDNNLLTNKNLHFQIPTLILSYIDYNYNQNIFYVDDYKKTYKKIISNIIDFFIKYNKNIFDNFKKISNELTDDNKNDNLFINTYKYYIYTKQFNTDINYLGKILEHLRIINEILTNYNKNNNIEIDNIINFIFKCYYLTTNEERNEFNEICNNNIIINFSGYYLEYNEYHAVSLIIHITTSYYYIIYVNTNYNLYIHKIQKEYINKYYTILKSIIFLSRLFNSLTILDSFFQNINFEEINNDNTPQYIKDIHKFDYIQKTGNCVIASCVNAYLIYQYLYYSEYYTFMKLNNNIDELIVYTYYNIINNIIMSDKNNIEYYENKKLLEQQYYLLNYLKDKINKGEYKISLLNTFYKDLNNNDIIFNNDRIQKIYKEILININKILSIKYTTYKYNFITPYKNTLYDKFILNQSLYNNLSTIQELFLTLLNNKNNNILQLLKPKLITYQQYENPNYTNEFYKIINIDNIFKSINNIYNILSSNNTDDYMYLINIISLLLSKLYNNGLINNIIIINEILNSIYNEIKNKGLYDKLYNENKEKYTKSYIFKRNFYYNFLYLVIGYNKFYKYILSKYSSNDIDNFYNHKFNNTDLKELKNIINNIKKITSIDKDNRLDLIFNYNNNLLTNYISNKDVKPFELTNQIKLTDIYNILYYNNMISYNNNNTYKYLYVLFDLINYINDNTFLDYLFYYITINYNENEHISLMTLLKNNIYHYLYDNFYNINDITYKKIIFDKLYINSEYLYNTIYNYNDYKLLLNHPNILKYDTIEKINNSLNNILNNIPNNINNNIKENIINIFFLIHLLFNKKVNKNEIIQLIIKFIFNYQNNYNFNIESLLPLIYNEYIKILKEKYNINLKFNYYIDNYILYDDVDNENSYIYNVLNNKFYKQLDINYYLYKYIYHNFSLIYINYELNDNNDDYNYLLLSDEDILIYNYNHNNNINNKNNILTLFNCDYIPELINNKPYYILSLKIKDIFLNFECHYNKYLSILYDLPYYNNFIYTLLNRYIKNKLEKNNTELSNNIYEYFNLKELIIKNENKTLNKELKSLLHIIIKILILYHFNLKNFYKKYLSISNNLNFNKLNISKEENYNINIINSNINNLNEFINDIKEIKEYNIKISKILYNNCKNHIFNSLCHLIYLFDEYNFNKFRYYYYILLYLFNNLKNFNNEFSENLLNELLNKNNKIKNINNIKNSLYKFYSDIYNIFNIDEINDKNNCYDKIIYDDINLLYFIYDEDDKKIINDYLIKIYNNNKYDFFNNIDRTINNNNIDENILNDIKNIISTNINQLDNNDDIKNNYINYNNKCNNIINTLYLNEYINNNNKNIQYIKDFETYTGYFIRNSNINLLYDIINNQEKEITNKKIYNIVMGQGKTSIITPLLIKYYFINKNIKNVFIILPKTLIKQSYNILLKYITYLKSIVVQITNKEEYENYILNIDEELNKIFYNTTIIKDNHNKYKIQLSKFINNLHKIYIISDDIIKEYCYDIFNNKNINNKNTIIIYDEIDSLMNPIKNVLNINIDNNINNTIISYLKNNDQKLYNLYNEYNLHFKVKILFNLIDIKDLNDLNDIKDLNDLNDKINKILNEIYERNLENEKIKSINYKIINDIKNLTYNLNYGLNDTLNNVSVIQAVPYSYANNPMIDMYFNDIFLNLILTYISYIYYLFIHIKNKDKLIIPLNALKQYYKQHNLSNGKNLFFKKNIKESGIIKNYIKFNSFDELLNILENYDNINIFNQIIKLYIKIINNNINNISLIEKYYSYSFFDILNNDYIKFGFSGTTYNINMKNYYFYNNENKLKNVLEINDKNLFKIVEEPKKYIINNYIKSFIFPNKNNNNIIFNSIEINNNNINNFYKDYYIIKNNNNLLNNLCNILIENNLKCFIDVNAILKYYNIYNIINIFKDKILNFNKNEYNKYNINKIIFYDNNDNLNYYNIINDKYIIIDKSNNITKDNDCFYFYFHKDIIGKDIKQYINIDGLISYNYNKTLFTDIIQGIYRMRQINKGHNFYLLDYYEDFINNNNINENINIEDKDYQKINLSIINYYKIYLKLNNNNNNINEYYNHRLLINNAYFICNYLLNYDLKNISYDNINVLYYLDNNFKENNTIYNIIKYNMKDNKLLDEEKLKNIFNKKFINENNYSQNKEKEKEIEKENNKLDKKTLSYNILYHYQTKINEINKFKYINSDYINNDIQNLININRKFIKNIDKNNKIRLLEKFKEIQDDNENKDIKFDIYIHNIKHHYFINTQMISNNNFRYCFYLNNNDIQYILNNSDYIFNKINFKIIEPCLLYTAMKYKDENYTMFVFDKDYNFYELNNNDEIIIINSFQQFYELIDNNNNYLSLFIHLFIYVYTFNYIFNNMICIKYNNIYILLLYITNILSSYKNILKTLLTDDYINKLKEQTEKLTNIINEYFNKYKI